MALWAARNQGIMFGGVSDEDVNEETMRSVFYNDLYVHLQLSFYLTRRLTLTQKRTSTGTQPLELAYLEASQEGKGEEGRRRTATQETCRRGGN